MRNKSLFWIAILIFAITQCTYHNEEDYFGDNQDNCDTSNVTFTNDVFPVMQINCVSCHNTNNTTAGVNLSDYNNIKRYAESGSLLGTIKHLPGFSPMPPSGPKLDDCTILKIEVWVEQELNNN